MSEEALMAVAGAALSLVFQGVKKLYQNAHNGEPMPSQTAGWTVMALSLLTGLFVKVAMGNFVVPVGDPLVVVGWLLEFQLFVFGSASVLYVALLKPETRLFFNRA